MDTGDMIEVRAAYDRGFDEGYLRGRDASDNEAIMLARANSELRSLVRKQEQQIHLLEQAVADMNLRYGGHT